MRFFSGVSNYRETPYIISDTFANKASYAATTKGALYIARDGASLSEPSIYQANGSIWVPIGSYGIGTDATLEDVTTNGNTTDKGIQITAGGLSTNSLTDTGLTAKSVPFVGTGGLITQDNTNFVWDNTNKWLGIQTNTPTAELDLHSTTSTPMLALNNTAGNPQNILFQNTNVSKWRLGNAASNTFTLFNNNLGVVAMSVKTTDNTFYVAGNLGINNSAPTRALDVNGTTNLGGVTNIQTTANSYYLQNNGATTGWTAQYALNSGGQLIFGLNGSAVGGIVTGASAYAGVIISSQDLEFYTATTKRLSIDKTNGFATFSNRVNINGASDDGSTALNVSGRGIFTGDVITQGGILTANNGGSINVFNVGTTNYFDLKSTGGNFALRTNLGVSAVNALTIAANGAATFINSLGTIALNMNNMSALGSVSGGSIFMPSTAAIAFRSSDGSIGYGTIKANISGALLLNSSNEGNVVIGGNTFSGVSSGSTGLEIKGVNAQLLINNQSYNWFTIYSATDSNIYNIFGSTGNYLLGTGNKDTSSFSEKLRVTSTGNLLINSTTDDTVNKFQVTGSAKFTNSISLASRQSFTSVGAQDGTTVNLATLMPNINFNGNFISIELQILSTDGGSGNSSIYNCIRTGAGVWTSTLVNSSGSVNIITLTFGGTSASPTLTLTGSAFPLFSVFYSVIIR